MEVASAVILLWLPFNLQSQMKSEKSDWKLQCYMVYMDINKGTLHIGPTLKTIPLEVLLDHFWLGIKNL